MAERIRLCKGCQKALPPLRGRQLGSRWHPHCRGALRRAQRLAARLRLEGRGPRRGPDHPAWRGGPIIRRKTRAWARLSAEIRAAWGHRCAWCGKPESENTPARGGEPRALALDHVRPYRLEGRDDPANLAPLCLVCHGRAGHAEFRAFWRGDALGQRAYERAVGARP